MVIKFALIMATYNASLLSKNQANVDYKIAVILAIPAVLSSYMIQYSAIMGLKGQNMEQ